MPKLMKPSALKICHGAPSVASMKSKVYALVTDRIWRIVITGLDVRAMGRVEDRILDPLWDAVTHD